MGRLSKRIKRQQIPSRNDVVTHAKQEEFDFGEYLMDLLKSVHMNSGVNLPPVCGQSGKLKDYVLVHSMNLNFPPVLPYSDTDDSSDVKATLMAANNIGTLLHDDLLPQLASNTLNDVSVIDGHLNNIKEAMDSLWNLNPHIFISYGIISASYYNYLACADILKNHTDDACKNFIRGMVYECIGCIRSLSLDTDDKVVAWMTANSPCMLNYNRLSNDKILNPFQEVKFSNMASVILNYLLFLSDEEVLSIFAVLVYCIHARNLLLLANKNRENEVDYDVTDIKTIVNIFSTKLLTSQNLLSHQKLSIEEWKIIVPYIKNCVNKIQGARSIDDIMERIIRRKMS